MIVSILILVPFVLLAAALTVPGWLKRRRQAAQPPVSASARPAPRARRASSSRRPDLPPAVTAPKKEP